MKKRNFIFSLIIFLGIVLFPKNVFAKELNITSISCGEVSGESTLLESKGQYLLMDTCDEDSTHGVIDYLKSKNISKLDIYISHYHKDHFGELSAIISESLNSNSFTIGKIYLPDGTSTDYLDYIRSRINSISVSSSDEANKASALQTINNVRTIRDNIKIQVNNITNTSKKPTITYLSLNDTLTLGDATINIIGPVKNRENLANELIEKYNYNAGEAYINNRSLVAMVTIGSTKFLTAGDIEYYEEQALISSGKDLSASIMKLSHHALGKAFPNNTYRLSNNTDFMAKVNPKYAFFSRPEEYLGEETNIANILADSKSENRNIINLYSAKYNGTTTINIKDNIITVNPTSNYKTIKVEYRDKYTNKEIATARYYNFSYNTSTDSNSVKIPFKLYGYKKSVSGYTFDSAKDTNGDEIVTSANEITSGNVYTLKYTKNTTPSDDDDESDDNPGSNSGDNSGNNSGDNNEVEVPDTSMTTSILFTIIGLAIVLLGGYIIYKGKKENKFN